MLTKLFWRFVPHAHDWALVARMDACYCRRCGIVRMTWELFE